MPRKTLASASLLLISSLVAQVSAHGYVEHVTLGDTKHTGYLPYVDPYMSPTPQRIIRKVPWNGPVQNVSLIDIQCNGYTAGGIPTEPAPLVGTIAAGQEAKLKWTSWPDNHKGPVITYMARVPDDQDIRKWSPGRDDAVWFKIHEVGKTADNKWGAVELLTEAKGVSTVKIPSTLKAGQYLIRHEILALHFAFAYPGVQIYPSCIQVKVTGGGDDFPSSEYLVSFPGAYKHDTPGIVYDLYSETGGYSIPGPAVWTPGA
ncbi:glycoside hydrolase [Coprinopsis marcescibilis]|uniref:lytic cellulose monooxygenase (C4-dehydrogenating) n=1 Tax=Coprinopsis marcescibilis TaxID=230819 RepID=A0A5C3L313_COPMA|nr:glycoside hydrolase [Coprinopsis marcescibilis]